MKKITILLEGENENTITAHIVRTASNIADGEKISILNVNICNMIRRKETNTKLFDIPEFMKNP